MKRCLLTFIFLYLTAISSCERILILAPICFTSHKFFIMPIAEALASRGHQVTLLTSLSAGSTNHSNLREISIASVLGQVKVDWFDMPGEGHLKTISRKMSEFQIMMTLGYDNLMRNQEFREIVQHREVDLVIVDSILNDFALPIIDVLKVPYVFFAPTSNVPWTVAAMGTSSDFASVPGSLTDFDDEMSFFQRVTNFMFIQSLLTARQYILLPAMDRYIRKDFPSARPIADIERDFSLCILNSYPTTAWPRPLPPTVIPIGPTHIKPPKPLPEVLRKFADDAHSGLIIFSLGSAIPVSSMPDRVRQSFVNVFAKIPQRVIWKWEKDNMLNVSSNVLLTPWLPQLDLLAHPRAALLISHGGLLGVQEAIEHAVPILVLPFGNDQPGNAAKLVKEGVALKLSWDDVNEQNLFEALTALTNTSSFQANATRLSKLVHDQIKPGKDVAVYWIEHILRHGGSKHLELSSKNMPFHQRYLLDVILFLVSIALLICFLLFRTLRRILMWANASRKPKTL